MVTKSARALLGALLLVTTLVAGLAVPASADYGTTPANATWKPVDGDVFALWQSGNMIYAGGEFTSVKQNLYDSGGLNQPYLAAFDATTGAVIPGFNPVFNGAVRDIVTSSDDSRIFVGGDFTSVDGLPNTARLVALDAVTGEVDTNFLGDANNSVYDIEIHGTSLYVGGKFYKVGGSNGGRLARLDQTTGLRDSTFTPTPDYYVDALEIPAAGDRIYVGGTFDNINGASVDKFVALDLNTGATISSFDPPYDQRIFDIIATNTTVTAVYGYYPNQIVVYNNNGSLIRRHSDGDGDYQALALNGSRTFVGGHSVRTSGLSRPSFASMDSATGILDSLRIDIFSPRGIWDIYPSGGSLWLGGDIRQVDGSNSGKMVRIPMASGQIAPSTPSVPTVSPSAATVALDWSDSTDSDGSVAGYRVIRSGKQIAYVTTSQFTDTSVVNGVTYAYNIEAIDNANNVSGRTSTVLASTIIDNQAPTAPGNVSVANVGPTGVTIDWTASTDNYGPISYEIQRDGVVVGTTSALTYTDTGLTPQTTYTYTVRAFDASSNYSNPGTPAIATTLPSSTPVPVNYIAYGGNWKYNVTGDDLGTAWREPAFNDSAWPSGAGELGFGDGDEDTVIARAPSPSLTSYFRSTFTVNDVLAVDSMSLGVIRDDGVAVYINGVEVGRDNLVANATYTTGGSTALGSPAESTPVSMTVNPSLLVNGVNTIAVEIHNSSFSSSDLSFDLKLDGMIVSVGGGDTQAPTAPGSLSVTPSAPNLNLAWTAATDNVGVTEYKVFRDGIELATVPGSTLSYSDSTVVVGQSYSYVVFAVDAANNVSPASNSASGTLAADTVPAESTIDSLTSNQILPAGPITFSGTGSDDSSGVAHVYMALRDRTTQNWLQPNGTFASGFALIDTTLSAPGALATNWSYTVTLPAGEYSVETRAEDVQANLEVTRPWLKFFTSTNANDTVEPVATITNPASNNQNLPAGAVTLTGAVTDDASGVSAVRLSIRDRTNSLWMQNNGTFASGFNLIEATVASPGATSTTWSVTINLPAGSWAVEARAVDVTGNTQSNRPWVPFTTS